MHPVGDLLRKTRIDKGLSLEQAAMSTRIRKHYLEALERGDREALPSPVQGRGFLRLYAGYLSLSSEDLVADWEGRPRPIPPAAAEPVQTPIPNTPGMAASPSDQTVEQLLSIPAAADEASEEAAAEAPGHSLPDLPPSPGGSNHILVEIGSALRAQRERLGLSLDDVERHTHIRERYLLSLEAGRLDQLPSTVQSRGMLSNYAAFLNLDAEALLLRFAESLQLRRIERLPAQPEPGARSTPRGPKQAGTVRRFLTPDLVFGAGLILVLFMFVVWTVSRLNVAGTTDPQVTLPSVSEILLATSVPTGSGETPLPTPQEGTTPSGSGSGSESGLVEQPAPTLAPPLAGGSIGEPTGTLGAINSDPLQVYIIARQRAFMRITVDGQLRFNGRLIPGNAYPYSGAERIDVLIGNAAAIQLFFNQNEIPGLAGAGESASVSFTQQGIQTPTPLPTATATITPDVTATPTVGTPVVSPTITPLVP